jgi:hypothetical protein
MCASSCTRFAIEPGNRWIARLAKDLLEATRILFCDRLRLDRAKPLLQLQRAKERDQNGHLLVEREADEERERVTGDELVRLVVVGEEESIGRHGQPS